MASYKQGRIKAPERIVCVLHLGVMYTASSVTTPFLRMLAALCQRSSSHKQRDNRTIISLFSLIRVSGDMKKRALWCLRTVFNPSERDKCSYSVCYFEKYVTWEIQREALQWCCRGLSGSTACTLIQISMKNEMISTMCDRCTRTRIKKSHYNSQHY